MINCIKDIFKKDILILGCSPEINNLDYEIIKNNNIIIVGLNSSYLKYPCDVLFFADKRFINRNIKRISKTQFCIYPKTLEQINIRNRHIYNPTRKLSYDIKRLYVGHSVIIPCFHLVNIIANKIYISGFEMKDKSHWNFACSRRFPKADNIRNEFLEIQHFFQRKVEFL